MHASHICSQYLKNIYSIKRISVWKNNIAMRRNNATVTKDNTHLYISKHVLLLRISTTWRSIRKINANTSCNLSIMYSAILSWLHSRVSLFVAIKLPGKRF